MAQLIRSAKFGNDWTENELFAFNISIQDVDVATFFGVPQLPPTTVSPVILNNLDRPPPPAVISKEDRLFFRYLERANIYEKPAVHDFADHILRMLDFDDNDRSIATKREMFFTMCGTHVSATADIVVLDDEKCSLIVQEEMRTTGIDEPKAPLIAAAIAAFAENNGLGPPQQTFPAMTMVGPRPVFYKIPVTQSLVDALVTAQYPAEPTVVQRLLPPGLSVNQYCRHGMNPLRHRPIVFQCLEALRGLLVG